MKIRTDFVTNSSSYSSAEVIIDNPVLLEILKKYEDMGTFSSRNQDFSIGNYENLEVDPHWSHEEISITPAIAVSVVEGSYPWSNVPSSLSDVVENILYCLEEVGSIKDNDLLGKMKSELEYRSDEITAAYKQVIWGNSDSDNDEGKAEDYNGYITDETIFTFDPLKGEDYHYIKSAGPGSDEKVKEGFVYSEEHIINGEVITDFEFEPKDEGKNDEETEDEESEDEDYDE